MADSDDFAYFSNVRRDIEWILPDRAPTRILEIGCGAGATLAWLKQRWPGAETVGVDGHAPLKATLEKRLDRALIHDLEQPLPDLGRFDLILALDVLEHLRDPEGVLERLVKSSLADGGAVIVSVPNLAHHRILRPLVLKRQFRYTEDGLLDRTHIRWFTEESALGMMGHAGLTVTDGVMTGIGGPRARIVHRLTGGRLRHYFTMQYIMRGEVGARPGFKWREW